MQQFGKVLGKHQLQQIYLMQTQIVIQTLVEEQILIIIRMDYQKEEIMIIIKTMQQATQQAGHMTQTQQK